MTHVDELEVAAWRLATGRLVFEDLPQLVTDARMRGLDTPRLRMLPDPEHAHLNDPTLPSKLRRLLADKDAAHYSSSLITVEKAKAIVRQATTLLAEVERL